MDSYLLFTDSAADLPQSAFEEYDIRIIPMDYMLNGKSVTFYTNSPDREKHCDELYQLLRQGADVHTSQITPYNYIKEWEPVLKEGHDLLYIAFSSGMSATYGNAVGAAKMLKDEYPDRTIEVIDSLSGTGGEGILTYTAALNRAKGMSLRENAAWMREHAVLMCHRFTVGDLDFLHRGGRVSAAVAVIGGMLNIKPVLIINDEGKLEMTGKSRGLNASLKSMVRSMKNQYGVEGVPDIIYIVHSSLPEKAAELKNMVRLAVGDKPTIEVLNETPIIGVHTGPEFFAVITYGRHRKES